VESLASVHPWRPTNSISTLCWPHSIPPGRLGLPQRPEAGARIFHQRPGLLERGEMRALRMALVVSELGIGFLGPLPRSRADLLGEGTYHDRNLDPLRGEEGALVFPVEASRRDPRLG